MALSKIFKLIITLIYRLYQTFIFLPVFIVFSILITSATIIGCFLGDGHFWAYYPPCLWSKFIIYGLFLPVRVKGREHLKPRQSYVFVANHQGAFDIFLINGYLHRHFKWMMKHDLFKIPFIGAACRAAHFIDVDKRGASKIRRTYEQAREILREGMSLVVFPEGARTFTGHMGFFRRGAFKLANELQLPVCPLTINGSFNVKPRMKDIWWVYWHPLSLTIHEPIEPIGQGDDNIHNAMDKSYKAIMSGLIPEYQGYVENDDQ